MLKKDGFESRKRSGAPLSSIPSDCTESRSSLLIRVNGSYNVVEQLTNSICVRSIVENARAYEVRNGGSIPSGRTKFLGDSNG